VIKLLDWLIIAFLSSILFIGIIIIFEQSLEMICFTDKWDKKQRRNIILTIIIAAIAVVISFKILMLLR